MSTHLIGAFGMFWQRDEVVWHRGPGPVSWQLLGHRGTRRPSLRICDFRRAAGFYVLWNEYRATYVGLARGSDGIGARLQSHSRDDSKDWSRFSWFAFDDTEDCAGLDNWQELVLRHDIAKADTETVVRECEALLITVLGTHTGGTQRRMAFQSGQEWNQVTTQHFAPDGLCRRVERRGFSDQSILADWE